ncbi:FAD-dependent monooxygenase [Sciscionella marina]|uniref:FAD-dependent monooxygenase n=1 Tax=Sciscionella marina TaxID=508770 RepID=UPI000375718F|nr:FAD-dependent monooxygenase [Sciscionella marina]
MKSRTILISGAGVAGPALAYWLREHGFAVTVVERAPEPRLGGQAIDIRGTARTVIQRMGLLDAVRAHHTGVHGIAYVDSRGRHQARMTNADFGDSGVIADLEIVRGDLVRLLTEAAQDGVEYRYGDTITALTERAHGVEVEFANAPAQTFDLVVGADGTGSRVRSLAFGPYREFVADRGYHTCYFPARLRQPLHGWELFYSLPAGNGFRGRNAVLYPVGEQGEARAMFAFAGPPLPHLPENAEQRLALLRRVYAGAGWEVPDLLGRLDAGEDIYLARAGRVRIDSYSRGRTVLLGDSAFAGSFGLGTSTSLVGAYVLAGELARAEGEHRRAFAEYERIMRPFVQAATTDPPGGVRGFLPPNRIEIGLRTLFIRAMPYLPGKERFTGGIAEAAETITLADYGLTVPR